MTTPQTSRPGVPCISPLDHHIDVIPASRLSTSLPLCTGCYLQQQQSAPRTLGGPNSWRQTESAWWSPRVATATAAQDANAHLFKLKLDRLDEGRRHVIRRLFACEAQVVI